MHVDKKELIEICRKKVLKHEEKTAIENQDKVKVVFNEPYIPYIPPDSWNGYLILSEAQNLSLNIERGKLDDYIEFLKRQDEKGRIERLGYHVGNSIDQYKDKIGVGPWDDNSLKLACAAVFPDQNLGEFSVSNAVLWSVVHSETKNNINPTPTLKARSIKIWEEFIEEMKPSLIITAGKVAHEVIESALKDKNRNVNHIQWAHSTSNYIGRISYLFPDVDDLLKRFSEVEKARQKIGLGKKIDTAFRNQVFYACHAVSTSISQKVNRERRS